LYGIRPAEKVLIIELVKYSNKECKNLKILKIANQPKTINNTVNVITALKILNLGCGTITSNKSGVINIDWSISTRLKKMKILRPIVPLLVGSKRLERFKSFPENIMVYDLSNGIPFHDDSVDVVYHSHFLEHLDRDTAEKFFIEVKRVLKPGGIHRIVVPDFEFFCKAYITHIASCELNPLESNTHDNYFVPLLEQFVRKETVGTSQQNYLRRFIENFVLCDARKRGDIHQWMYDRINLKAKLINAGYKEVLLQSYITSLIPNWNEYELDIDKHGNQYRQNSLYIEAIK
jgi:SAM-dependent methyltransferase